MSLLKIEVEFDPETRKGHVRFFEPECGLEGKNQFTDKNWAILVKAKTTRVHMVSHSDLYSLRIPE